MRVLVVRHHLEDSAGFIADAFAARGAEISVLRFPADGPLPAPETADHIVLLGATCSVNDDGPDHPWIGEALAWLRRADDAGVPVFGICFGAQALSVAFGGEVKAAAAKEIGWRTIDVADGDAVPSGPWLEFHGDVCLPPAQARVLASNDVGVQAFRLGRHLGVQFHPEVDSAQFRLWLESGARGEAELAGQDPDQLLARTIAEEPAARERADRLVDLALRIAADA